MYIFKKQIVGSNLFAKTNLWFTIGFILTAALTFSEVARGRQYNFMIFSDATRQGRRIKMRCPVKVLTGIFHPILLSAF